jgi:hypothetical protein
MESRKTIRLEPTQSPKSPLSRLIRDDLPLPSGTTLVLMFNGSQAEMPSNQNQGIRTWLQAEIALHGLPSLVRFGRRDRPSVFRRDEFVLWLSGGEASVVNL